MTDEARAQPALHLEAERGVFGQQSEKLLPNHTAQTGSRGQVLLAPMAGAMGLIEIDLMAASGVEALLAAAFADTLLTWRRLSHGPIVPLEPRQGQELASKRVHI